MTDAPAAPEPDPGSTPAPDPGPPAPPAAPPPRTRRPGRTLAAWVRTLATAFVVAVLLRTCAFEPYQIPSESMEGTLLVGDFLLVSKLHYGPRLPVTVGLPGAARRFPTGLPNRRLPGFSSLRRGDVVVFNFPPERGPVDGRTPFIKRLVGLPGDTLRVTDKAVYVNGTRVPLPAVARQLWRVRTRRADSLDPDAIAAVGALDRGGHGTERLVEATVAGAARLVRLRGVTRVSPFVRPLGDESARFPAGAGYSLDDYGPIVVPRRGQTVTLEARTWPLVRDAITREAAAAGQEPPRRRMDGFIIDGTAATTYTFREDHLFVMGDNRDDSADSRTWGFVPESYLIGKAVLVYFSWDAETGHARWERALRRIR